MEDIKVDVTVRDPQGMQMISNLKSLKNYCQICNKQFSTLGNLRNHKMTIHDNQRPFKCLFEKCNKMYSIESRLQVHLRTHTGSKPFVCGQCGKSFNEKGNLKTHERFHSESRPFECKECNKSYKTNGHLKDHIEIQHMKLRKFKCYHCEKRFGRISTLKAHIRTHTGEKNYQCKIAGCLKKFAEKGNMEIHYRRHLKRMMNEPCSLPSVSSGEVLKYEITPSESVLSHLQVDLKQYDDEEIDKGNAITRPNSYFALYNIQEMPCDVLQECENFLLFSNNTPKNDMEYLESLTELNIDLDKPLGGFF